MNEKVGGRSEQLAAHSYPRAVSRQLVWRGSQHSRAEQQSTAEDQQAVSNCWEPIISCLPFLYPSVC